MDILLTNDDGIDSPGLRLLYEALSALGDVLVVAPAEDQSAIGRALSTEVAIEERDIGYAIAGTPSDCVVAGLEAIGPHPDIVVAGCNRGANLGAYTLGRSGTVSAAVEAAFFDVPAIAVSMYVPTGDVAFVDTDPDDGAYGDAIRAATYLVERAPAAGVFDHADYLNVNAPPTRETPAPMEVTRPSQTHAMDAVRNGEGTIRLTDRIWEHMRVGEIDDPPGTDRRAVFEGSISVSPLTAPHSTEHHDALDDLAATFTAEG